MKEILFIVFALIPRQGSDTILASLAVRIADHPSGTSFLVGEVSGIAVDESGRIYVTDFQEPRILVFGPDGRLLVTIGRKGRGPGELVAPTGPAFGPDGALYVRNSEQVLRFIRDPATGLPTVFDRSFRGPTMAPWRSKLPSVIDHAGRFHFPMEVGLPDGLTHYAYWRFSLVGSRLDSLPVPTYPTTRSSWASYRSRMIPGVNVVPFHPNPAWAVTLSGTVLSGPADRYELRETDSAGRLVRRISRQASPMRIPRQERSESLRALKRRIDSLPGSVMEVRGASEEVRQQRLPAIYPAYRDVLMTHGGQLWVRRWSPPFLRGKTVLDVFRTDGGFVHTLVLPMNCASLPAIAVRGKTVACVHVHEESGEESIVVARLP